MESFAIVVDDHPHNLAMVKLILEFEGHYTVYDFQDPVVALREVLRMEIPPVLVISDFRMPGINGIQLLDTLTQAYPDLEAVLMTSEPSEAREAARDYPILDKNRADFVVRISEMAVKQRQLR